jgi:uncharacterized membrane protein YhaH (DUF805 family)
VRAASAQVMVLFRGTVGRGRFAAIGSALIALKYGLDSVLAAAFDRSWSYTDYWSPSAYSVERLPPAERWFFLALVLLALPFAIAGLSLTVRRLRDTRLPLALVVLFFVPIVNLLFFATLCLLPPAASGAPPQVPARDPKTRRLLPGSKLGSALAGVALTVVLGAALMVFATEALETYGWGLFMGLPFCLGLLSSLVYNHAEQQSLMSSMLVGVLATGLASLSLLAVALEGAICLVMAMPITAPLAMVGAVTGHAMHRGGPAAPAMPSALCSIAIVLPALMGVEARTADEPAVRAVTTTVVVDAPPELVWRRVIAFPKLPAPREAIFRAGIAYPIGARIEGRGVGAIRRCSFSTGDFVEPITVWDAPRRLAFSVAQQPPPMRELTPYGNVHPPHLDGFLRSRRGEFALERLPGGRTRLTGTTWYENRMAPQAYWRTWSDAMIHRIHLRVLRWVAELSERDAANGATRGS